MRLEYVNGHIILESEGARVLLDTGAPLSVGDLSDWRFEGMPVTLEPDFHGVTTDKLSEHLGARIDVLLGMDFLARHVFQIDLGNHELRFLGPDDTLPAGQSVPMKALVGVPTIGFQLNGHAVRAFLDTGARLSYLSAELIDQYDTIGTVRDFHPSAGVFETDVRLVPVQFGETTATLHGGSLPPVLDASLRAAGVRGIVGTDLLEQFIATFAMPLRELILSRPPDDEMESGGQRRR